MRAAAGLPPRVRKDSPFRLAPKVDTDESGRAWLQAAPARTVSEPGHHAGSALTGRLRGPYNPTPSSGFRRICVGMAELVDALG